MRLMLALLILCVFMIYGCGESGAGAAALGCFGDVMDREAAQSKASNMFLDKYQKTNLEREKAGLPPLDLCTEIYHFKSFSAYPKEWAREDPVCEIRIEAYEAGDKSALGKPQLIFNNEEESEIKTDGN